MSIDKYDRSYRDRCMPKRCALSCDNNLGAPQGVQVLVHSQQLCQQRIPASQAHSIPPALPSPSQQAQETEPEKERPSARHSQVCNAVFG